MLDGGAPEVLSEIRAGSLNPYSAARQIIEDRNSLLQLLEVRDGNAKADAK